MVRQSRNDPEKLSAGRQPSGDLKTTSFHLTESFFALRMF
jgi:hypothetical protein